MCFLFLPLQDLAGISAAATRSSKYPIHHAVLQISQSPHDHSGIFLPPRGPSGIPVLQHASERLQAAHDTHEGIEGRRVGRVLGPDAERGYQSGHEEEQLNLSQVVTHAQSLACNGKHPRRQDEGQR